MKKINKKDYNKMYNSKQFISNNYLTENAYNTAAMVGYWGLMYVGQKALINKYKNRKIAKYDQLGNINNCNKLENTNDVYKCKKYFIRQEYLINIIKYKSQIAMLKDIKNTDKKIGQYDSEKFEKNMQNLKDILKNEEKLFDHKLKMLKIQYKGQI